MHKPGSFGDERSAARVRRTAGQADGAIRPGEPGHDGNGLHWASTLRLDHWAVCVVSLLAQANERLTQLPVDWNDSAAAFLGHAILKLERGRDLAAWVYHHLPNQVSDFGGSQASFHGQQHNHPIAKRMSCVLREEQQVFDVSWAEYLCTFADHEMPLNTLFVNCMVHHEKYNRKSDSIFNKTFPGSTVAKQTMGGKLK